MYIPDGGAFHLQNKASGSWETNIKAVGDGGVHLYHDNSTVCYTDTGALRFNDNQYIKFGNNQDFKIHHNGSLNILDAATSNTISFQFNGTEKASIDSSGTVSDSKGNLRDIVQNVKTSAYTLVASDAGKCVQNSSGGWTIPVSTFSGGNAVTLLNNSASDLNITATALTYLWNTADGANIKANTIALGARTMATIWFMSGSEGYIQAGSMTVS